jgi:hypothetical protein
MIPDTFIEVKNDGIYMNGEKVPHWEDFQQQAVELKSNILFQFIVADAKTRAYKDGFLGTKGFFACAVNMEKLLQQIIDFK